jgi:hypothetical protein
MSRYECLCVACGTQCEICLERYPDDCICPSDSDLSDKDLKRLVQDHKKKLYETAKRQRKLDEKRNKTNES